MNHEPYVFQSNEENDHFRFQSVGKRGTVEKVVVFSMIENGIYNLALLDFDPLTQDYTDRSVTDNGDMPQVLATVLTIIIDYLDYYRDRKIYLSGNTESRTRLYQIAINKILSEINDRVSVLGYYDSRWVPFEPKTAFESFLITRNFID